MKRRLFLLGEIGCGKSTLIRRALGPAAVRAGGFVTLRTAEGGRLRGFELAPAAALAGARPAEARRFLSFDGGVRRDDAVFAEFGARLLREAAGAPFAVLDEIGGLELLVPPFSEALEALLRAGTPCVGVLKTAAAAEALRQRTNPGADYIARHAALRRRLEADGDTLLLPTAGRGDGAAEEALRRWADTYAMR